MSRHDIGEIGILIKDLIPLCCGNVIPSGTIIKILDQTSPNRFTVKAEAHQGGCHNVRASSVWFLGESFSP